MRRQGERPELIRWRLCGRSKSCSLVPQRRMAIFCARSRTIMLVRPCLAVRDRGDRPREFLKAVRPFPKSLARSVRPSTPGAGLDEGTRAAGPPPLQPGPATGSALDANPTRASLCPTPRRKPFVALCRRRRPSVAHEHPARQAQLFSEPSSNASGPVASSPWSSTETAETIEYRASR